MPNIYRSALADLSSLETETITIRTARGPQAIEAMQFGPLALHLTPLTNGETSARWSISHTASGMLIAAGWMFDDALMLAGALMVAVDWSTITTDAHGVCHDKKARKATEATIARYREVRDA